MSKKDRILRDSGLTETTFYTGFFESFNRAEFFEAHDILEQLWLQDRKGPDGNFYKGLIQLAGAFVHVQKKRPGPAISLLTLSETNLCSYAPAHKGLEIASLQRIIHEWRGVLGNSKSSPLPPFPQISPNTR